MNERVKALEAQCWETRKHPVSQAAMGDKFNTEKFAELIVRECANIVNNLDQYEGEGDCSTAEYMKKCFGVE